MEKSNYVMKGLGFAYLLTLIILLVYNALLTFTSMSGDTITMATSFITTISAAFGGFYASKKIKEKGLIFGVIVGLMYIVLVFLTVFLVQDKFVFDMSMLYRILLMGAAGGIGGVLGVNFK